jgi:serine/threonine protein kinase
VSDPLALPVVPDYALLRKIGVGSYGEVWLARGATGSLRAVKIVRRSSFEEDRPYEREFAGLKSFELVSHARENQLNILHVGRNENARFFYYVMELADDARTPTSPTPTPTPAPDVPNEIIQVDSYCPRTLKQVLCESGPLSVSACVQIGLSLASALEHLHAHGLVHRDIKPSNIIFVRGLPKLADIGLVSGIDATRSFVGTEGYVPPDGPGTPQADIYGLGKVLYELVTGNDRLAYPELPQDWRARPDGDQRLELNEIINRACDWDPKRRYAEAAQLRQDFERLQKGQSIRAVRIRKRRLHLARRAAAPILLLVFTALAAVWFSRIGSLEKHRSTDPEAKRLYEQAQLLLMQNTFEQAAKAYSKLEEAVRRDPNFVDAYYRMFETCWDDWGDKIPPLYDQIGNQRLIVSNLFVHAPKSVQYHTANAYLNYSDWHFDQALQEAALAVRCDPTFLRAHVIYGWISLITRGDVELARRELKIAERIDGADLLTQNQLAVTYYFQRQYPLAIDQFRILTQTMPNSGVGHYRLGRTLEAYAEELRRTGELEKAVGACAKAIDEYERYEISRGSKPEATRAQFQLERDALKVKGCVGWYQARLDFLQRNTPGEHYFIARTHARLGKFDLALVSLEQAWRERDGEMVKLLEDDCWDGMRERPEFRDLLRKMDLRPGTHVARGKAGH